MVIHQPSSPGFERHGGSSFTRWRHMSTYSIWEESWKSAGKILRILVVVHENMTITNPCYHWYLVGLFTSPWSIHHFHQRHDHLQLWNLPLSFDVAVDRPTCYGAICHVVQCIMEVVLRQPFHVAAVRAAFVRISVFWYMDDCFLEHRGDETLCPLIDQFVVDLNSPVQWVMFA